MVYWLYSTCCPLALYIQFLALPLRHTLFKQAKPSTSFAFIPLKISFQAQTIPIHARSWITIPMPTSSYLAKSSIDIQFHLTLLSRFSCFWWLSGFAFLLYKTIPRALLLRFCSVVCLWRKKHSFVFLFFMILAQNINGKHGSWI